MKKVLIVLVTLLLGVALFVPNAMAKKPPKVDVCHLIEANDVVYGFWGVVDLYFGRVISVDESAVESHEAHGDSTSFFTNQDAIDTFRGVGFHLPNANCYVSVPSAG